MKYKPVDLFVGIDKEPTQNFDDSCANQNMRLLFKRRDNHSTTKYHSCDPQGCPGTNNNPKAWEQKTRINV